MHSSFGEQMAAMHFAGRNNMMVPETLLKRVHAISFFCFPFFCVFLGGKME